MSIAKDPHSRFLLSNPIIHNGVEAFGIMTKHFFLDQNNLKDDQIISVEITPDLAGKPWAVANKLYNSPVLDWVIVLFNRPINPVNWPYIGTVIKAPIESVVVPNV
jgi:hypothetical protein